MSVVLQLQGLEKTFRIRGGQEVRAVKGVDLHVGRGETYGLVGESGSGKSTVARMVARLTDPSAGRILFKDEDITQMSRARLKSYRTDVQIVFQDPYGALNARMTVAELVTEPLVIHKRGTSADRMRRAKELIELVGLPGNALDRRPVDFSGGQRQRIMIARALALQPQLIVADEPVSALDVSVQAQVLNLLKDLQDEFGLSYLFISHDLSVVQFISDRIGVMYQGELIEEGDRDEVYAAPRHEYTKTLIDSIPSIGSLR